MWNQCRIAVVSRGSVCACGGAQHIFSVLVCTVTSTGDTGIGIVAVARSIVPLASLGRVISGVSRSSSTKGRIDSHVSSTLANVQKEGRYVLGSRR